MGWRVGSGYLGVVWVCAYNGCPFRGGWGRGTVATLRIVLPSSPILTATLISPSIFGYRVLADAGALAAVLANPSDRTAREGGSKVGETRSGPNEVGAETPDEAAAVVGRGVGRGMCGKGGVWVGRGGWGGVGSEGCGWRGMWIRRGWVGRNAIGEESSRE